MKTRIVLTLIAVRGARRLRRRLERAAAAPSSRPSIRSRSRREQIGGDGVDVRNLTPPGVEPHDLELSGATSATIADADLVLYLGGGFQPALEDAIDAHVGARGRPPRRGRDPRAAGRSARLARSGPLRGDRRADRRGARPRGRGRAFAARLRALDREFRARPRRLRARRDRHEPRGVRLSGRALRARAGRDHRASRPRPSRRRATSRTSSTQVRARRRDDGLLRDARLAAARRDGRARGRRARPPCSIRSKG